MLLSSSNVLTPQFYEPDGIDFLPESVNFSRINVNNHSVHCFSEMKFKRITFSVNYTQRVDRPLFQLQVLHHRIQSTNAIFRPIEKSFKDTCLQYQRLTFINHQLSFHNERWYIILYSITTLNLAVEQRVSFYLFYRRPSQKPTETLN